MQFFPSRQSWRRRLSGHLWTIAPVLEHRLRPRMAASVVHGTPLVDPVAGAFVLTGYLHDVPGSNTLAVVVHGCGGSPDSHYCVRAARLFGRHGMACLRLALRGADNLGADFYHAAQTADLHAVLDDPALARFGKVHVVGFSVGGHLALRFAAERVDRRLASVVAICPPLDLELSCQRIDEPSRWFYRRHVLSGLFRNYVSTAARRPVPTPVPKLLSARTIREYDTLAVVPRYGFRSAEEYYSWASAAPHLSTLRTPSLILATRDDPMVHAEDITNCIPSHAPNLQVRWMTRGGHLGFPRASSPHPQHPAAGLEQHLLQFVRNPLHPPCCSLESLGHANHHPT